MAERSRTLVIFLAVGCSCVAATFKEDCLRSHNNYRKLHHAQDLTWSDELEEQARQWAGYLAANNKFQHGSSGENLYITGIMDPGVCVRATKSFYDEIEYYNFNKPGFSMNSGHFTQIVWAKTTKMGAVKTVRQDGALLVVIRYNPPGNINTAAAFRENVRPTDYNSGGSTTYKLESALLATLGVFMVVLNA